MFARREFILVHQRLTRIERALDLVMRRLEIHPAEIADPTPAVSPRVRELAAGGQLINAVRQLRSERPELDPKAATQLVRSLG